MQDLLSLYLYIKNKYHNYQMIEYSEMEISIVFHGALEMKIRLEGYFGIYFNNIFYYDVEWQDIRDTIDDFFTNQYAICEKNKKLKIVKKEKFCENGKYNHVWTIEKVLK